MAIDAQNAIQMINDGEFAKFDNEDLINLAKTLPSAGKEGAEAFAKLKDFIGTNLMAPFAEGIYQLNPKDMDVFEELVKIYGIGADGKAIKGQTSGKTVQEAFDVYKKFNDVNIDAKTIEDNAAKLEEFEQKHNIADSKFESKGRKLLDRMDIDNDTKADVLEAVRLNAYTDSLVDGKLDEAKYVENLKSNIELAVYSMLTGTAISKAGAEANKTKKIEVGAVLDQAIAVTDKENSTLKVNGDAVMGYLATTLDRTESIKDRIKNKLGNIPVLAKLNKKISQLDDKFSKKYGKRYEVAKTAVKVVSNIGANSLMLCAAGGLGPVGLAAYGVYAFYNGMKPMVQSWKASRKEYKTFGAFLKDNKLNALTAVSGVLALGVAGYNAGNAALQAAGGQLNSATANSLLGYASKTRATLAYGTVALKNAVDIKDAYNKGEGKSKAWVKAGVTALAFVVNYHLAGAFQADSNVSEKSGLTLPDGRDLNEAKVDSAVQSSVAEDSAVQESVAEDSTQVSAKADTAVTTDTEQDPCEEIENALRGNQQQGAEQNVDNGDCNGKIEAQARDHTLHTEFWDNRNRHFLGDDLTNALYGLFEGDKPTLNLGDFEGIDNKEEFVYKYAIMKANNIPEQRVLVDMIEKACGGQLTQNDYIDIARGMNSYDNHGNPLCWENTQNTGGTRLADDFVRCDPEPTKPEPVDFKPVAEPVSPEPVQPVEPEPSQPVQPVEPVQEAEPAKIYKGKIVEHVTLDNVPQDKIKGYDYDFYDAPIPEKEAAQGYDYDVDGNKGEPAPILEADAVAGKIAMANGGKVEYTFYNGAAQIQYEMPGDKYADEVAAHLEGFTDKPETMSRRYAAYSEVYYDLHNRLAEGETIKGAEEWMDWMDKHLAKRGLFIDDKGYIAVNQNVDRELLLEAYRKDPDGLMTDKEMRQLEKETEKAEKQAAKEAAKAEKEAAKEAAKAEKEAAKMAKMKAKSNSWDY